MVELGGEQCTVLAIRFVDTRGRAPRWSAQMFTFDRDTFFRMYEAAFAALSPPAASGLGALLASLEEDPDVSNVRWAAYMMATVKHECADRWQPIEEFGKGQGRPYGIQVQATGSNGKQYLNVYYGRGYVQLTWKDNYEKMSRVLGLSDELLIYPERVMEPEIAYKIMSYG